MPVRDIGGGRLRNTLSYCSQLQCNEEIVEAHHFLQRIVESLQLSALQLVEICHGALSQLHRSRLCVLRACSGDYTQATKQKKSAAICTTHVQQQQQQQQHYPHQQQY